MHVIKGDTRGFNQLIVWDVLSEQYGPVDFRFRGASFVRGLFH